MPGRYEFRSNENRMTERMAIGHALRKGHELRGVWVYTMPGFRTLQRRCCK